MKLLTKTNRNYPCEKKLSRAISAEVNVKITPKKQTMKDIFNVVKKELLNFEIEGKRGTNLQRCHENLSSIPPVSVESERIFSGCSHILTKIRSSLSDESLDILSFLRSYFQSKKFELKKYICLVNFL